MDKSSYGRKDRLLKERQHDVYRIGIKLPDPTLCTECGAVFMKGRWVWADAPAHAGKAVCPACRRIADRFPVGRIEMQGGFFTKHHDEILNLVKNVEHREKANHPLERIMEIREDEGRTVITTTGIHVARGIGTALSSAYNGEMTMRYLDGETGVQVRWTR